MTTAEKSEAILRKITEIIDADPSKPTVVGFSQGWGPHTVTVHITGQGHTPCGSFSPDSKWEYLVDHLYDLFVENRGLSFAGKRGT